MINNDRKAKHAKNQEQGNFVYGFKYILNIVGGGAIAPSASPASTVPDVTDLTCDKIPQLLIVNFPIIVPVFLNKLLQCSANYEYLIHQQHIPKFPHCDIATAVGVEPCHGPQGISQLLLVCAFEAIGDLLCQCIVVSFVFAAIFIFIYRN